MTLTAYGIAERYLDVGEFHGDEDHPAIQWWLMNAGQGRHAHDEIPWCGAFVHHPAWELDLPRPRFPARARSWLTVGTPIDLAEAVRGFDIVVLKRGGGNQPGPEVLDAPGHVGFYHGQDHDVWLLSGNQMNRVTIAPFPVERVLGARRLYDEGW
jgi:uncharacterized protein (TIGR02594 family)